MSFFSEEIRGLTPLRLVLGVVAGFTPLAALLGYWGSYVMTLSRSPGLPPAFHDQLALRGAVFMAVLVPVLGTVGLLLIPLLRNRQRRRR